MTGPLPETWPYALVSGGTALAAFLALPPQSLPHKYLDGDVNLLIPYGGLSLVAAGLGVLVALLVWGRRGGRTPPWRHLAVPPVLVVLVPLVLAMCGGARSRWETGLLCAVVAAGVHVALGLPRRRFRLLLCGLLAGSAVLTAVVSQTRWRAEDFRATGLPYVVADVPGYVLSGTYADVGAIFLAYRDVAGRGMQLDAVVSRGTCQAETRPQVQCLELTGGGHLAVGRPYERGSGRQDATPTPVTVRPVTAEYLAAQPEGDVSLPD
jgi:hypothetical protein